MFVLSNSCHWVQNRFRTGLRTDLEPVKNRFRTVSYSEPCLNRFNTDLFDCYS